MKRYAVQFRIVVRNGDPWRLDKHYRTILFARLSAAAYATMGWPSRIIDTVSGTLVFESGGG